MYGRNIFTGWKKQELLSRLLTHVLDELQNNLLERRHPPENISTNPAHLISSVKRQGLGACGTVEGSCLAEKFSADISEQTGLSCALKSHDDDSIDVPRVSDFEEKVTFLVLPKAILYTDSPQESCKSLPLLSLISSNPPLLPVDTGNGEPGMLETEGSQFAIVNNDAVLLKSDTTVSAEEKQPLMVLGGKAKESGRG
ncbi:hypothetical protein V6N13_052180 [Hibiscus sabdariffa]|uniref:Uncharacterized protein n=2 Tax=Hibiscus sabdariffa TaxID=183260 RepID=A0ABR1ZVG5_9ROSI